MHFENDDQEFSAPAYTVKGYSGIAWYVLGWETVPDEDTEWSGVEVRTGRIICVMVGDDSHFSFNHDEITPLKPEDYCGSCGQIGCCHG